MDCKTVLERINAYLDGELPGNVMQSVEQHISQCRGCKEELQSIRALNAMLDRAPEMVVPRDFAKETVRKGMLLKKEGLTLSEWWRSLTHIWKFAACAAAVAGLLAGGLVPQSLYMQTVGAKVQKGLSLYSGESSLTKVYMQIAAPTEERD